jgi:hypothetical protein
MTEVEIARNEIADPQLARQVADEVVEVAATARGLAREILGLAILDEGQHLEIEVEVPGWTERISVPSPARPGAVRRAVAKVFRDLGLTDPR